MARILEYDIISACAVRIPSAKHRTRDFQLPRHPQGDPDVARILRALGFVGDRLPRAERMRGWYFVGMGLVIRKRVGIARINEYHCGLGLRCGGGTGRALVPEAALALNISQRSNLS